MRKFGAKGLAALFGMGLIVSSASAQTKDEDYHSMEAPKPSWFSGWFGSGPAKPDPKKPVVPASGPPTRLPTVDAAQMQREQEEKTYLRRDAACLRLLDIAEEKNDDTLRRQATELQTRAWEIYQQRTAPCRCARAPTTPTKRCWTKSLGLSRNRVCSVWDRPEQQARHPIRGGTIHEADRNNRLLGRPHR